MFLYVDVFSCSLLIFFLLMSVQWSAVWSRCGWLVKGVRREQREVEVEGEGEGGVGKRGDSGRGAAEDTMRRGQEVMIMYVHK